MTTKNTGGQAFPSNAPIHPLAPNGGMTLRDYFAGQALTGLIAAVPGAQRITWVAEAYCISDDMLKERGRE